MMEALPITRDQMLCEVIDAFEDVIRSKVFPQNQLTDLGFDSTHRQALVLCLAQRFRRKGLPVNTDALETTVLDATADAIAAVTAVSNSVYFNLARITELNAQRDQGTSS